MPPFPSLSHQRTAAGSARAPPGGPKGPSTRQHAEPQLSRKPCRSPARLISSAPVNTQRKSKVSARAELREEGRWARPTDVCHLCRTWKCRRVGEMEVLLRELGLAPRLLTGREDVAKIGLHTEGFSSLVPPFGGKLADERRASSSQPDSGMRRPRKMSTNGTGSGDTAELRGRRRPRLPAGGEARATPPLAHSGQSEGRRRAPKMLTRC